MEEDYTDERLEEITRDKQEAIRQGLWKPGKVEDLVRGALRKKRERRRRAQGRAKDRNRRELPKEKFTIIPNEFIEEVSKQYLRPNESKVLWHLVRKTWGWGKKSDFIALKQFTKELRICKVTACQALTRLKHRRIVNQLANKTYTIQTDTSLWRDKPKRKKKK